MRAAIFSFVKVSETSMVASVRIARFISEHFGIPIYTDERVAEQNLDLLIIVNGAYGFSKHLASLAEIVLRAKRVVWVQNDFTIVPPKNDSNGVSPFRAAFRDREKIRGLPHMDFWTTCEDWQSFTPNSRYVNWNALTFDENYSPKVITKRRQTAVNNLLYYGSYRAGGGKSSRERYFDRYFADPKVSTTISSPAKQFKEKYLSPKIQHMGAINLDFFNMLGTAGLGLYIEDRMSHEKFHSPANRFYEMLSAGLPMVFQPEAQSMMRRAGYDVEPYVAHSALSLPKLMAKREEIGQQQRRDWIDEKGGPVEFRLLLLDQMNLAMDLQTRELK